jgi:hypothetical protein
MSIWDEPEMQNNTEYVKFENVGDTVTGVVIGVGVKRWDDGTMCPQIILDCEGTERIVTAGQVRLKAALAEKRPEAGDTIAITFSQVEKRSGGKTLKHFDVNVSKGDAPAAAPAAPATHSREQIEAMKLLGIETAQPF